MGSQKQLLCKLYDKIIISKVWVNLKFRVLKSFRKFSKVFEWEKKIETLL
jgi:hypothetical protein